MLATISSLIHFSVAKTAIMKNTIVFTLILIAGTAPAQRPEYIHLQPSSITIERSIFDKVEVVDTRFDTVYMGFVQKGAMNRKAPIRLTQSMQDEIGATAAAMLKNAEQEVGTVLVNIRSFFMSEVTAGLSESGTFIFKADCYLKQGEAYHKMFAIDTNITVRSGWDVTKKLITLAERQVGTMLQDAAAFNPASLNIVAAYTLREIEHIDETEKKLLPVYNVPLPARGLYASYEDFKNNMPSTTDFLEEFDQKKKANGFWYVNADGTKGKPVLQNENYAICNGTELYICTQYGTYPTTRRNYDFYFVGLGKEAANTATVATATLLFGMLGGMIASAPHNAHFEYRIDHSTGKFLPVRKM